MHDSENNSAHKGPNLVTILGAGAFSLGNGSGTSNITTFNGTMTMGNNSSNTATLASDLVLATTFSGNTGFAFSGSGDWLVNTNLRSNTYTGATTVSAGTLLVNGALGNTPVSVTGGAIGGTGSVGGTVSVSGSGTTVSPGASIESLATGALAMSAGTVFKFEAISADLLVVNGDLSLAGVTLDLSSANLAALTWTLGDKIPLLSYTGTPLTSGFTGFDDDTSYVFGGNERLFNYNDTFAGSNYNTEATGTSFVTLTAIPEPHAALLGGLGLLALLRRRRA